MDQAKISRRSLVDAAAAATAAAMTTGAAPAPARSPASDPARSLTPTPAAALTPAPAPAAAPAATPTPAPTPDDPSITPNGHTHVHVDITNTGRRAGNEVVQLYVTDDRASVSLPRIRLRGVAKKRVAAGERVTVSFPVVAARDLTLVDERLRTVVEPGTFTLSIGSASDRLHQHISLAVS